MSQLEFNEGVDDARVTYFTDVILPVPIPRMFTYRVPLELNEEIEIGSRVIVQFGNRKILTGIVGNIHDKPPEKYEAKYILEILDSAPVMFQQQIDIMQWIADYYMCTIGEVLNVALPSGLKLSSESRIQLHPHFDYYESDITFSESEATVIESLQKNDSLTYSDVSKLLGVKTVYSLLKSLVVKEAIIIFEEVKEKYKPKKEKRIRLKQSLASDQKQLESIFQSISSTAKQEEVLLFYLQRIPVYNNPKLNDKGIDKSDFKSAGLSTSSLKTLIKNNILEEFEVIISRFGDYESELVDVVLSKDQETTKKAILSQFDDKSTVLLHGITGSGKTEIYISLIKDALAGGNQVLYLLPEIALTTQIVVRLRKIFGDKMGVYHSKFSDNERVEVWNGVLSGKYQFVVGVRSAVFLPFDNLGLIVVDEEHESSFKQYDPAPRYHAKDVAQVIAQKQYAKVILGSATPAIETYHLAQTGKFGIVELKARYGEGQLPQFEVADMLRERAKKTSRGEFSSTLIEAISKTLENKEQVIIFQNRRGYSPYISCEQCGWIPKCTNCAVSLTYHQYRSEIKCHYCGYKEPMPSSCEACGSTALKTVGFGTEKLEEELSLLFPQAKIQRMDLDTTRRKNSYEHIINDFENQEIDILVGTQMVSKGLDFDKVNLVGIVDLDRMLHFPDFRSYERTFYLSTQVSGRAGRRDKRGKVVIQTKNKEQPILKHIIHNEYEQFFSLEIKERQEHNYPPFTRLIRITIKNKDPKIAEHAALKLSNLLKEQLGTSRILGPQEPVISKIRNEFLREIWIKLERKKIAIGKAKERISEVALEVSNYKELKGTKIVFDVDPY